MKFVIFFCLFVSAVVRADSAMSGEDVQIQQRAKSRQYPGGKDEESLQVQTQLPFTARKMQPAQEPVDGADESPTPASND